jgi:predicted RNA-binding protein with PUA-like domain
MPKPTLKTKSKPAPADLPPTTAAAIGCTHWLIKSEPDCYSIDDLKRDGATDWSGVRNFAARNFMRDHMKPGHAVLFYHSGGDAGGEPAIVGLARVSSAPKPDLTALDRDDDHDDPKSTGDNPIWMLVEVKFASKFKRPITLKALKSKPDLAGMAVLQRGQRLSVMPVSEAHFKIVYAMGEG